MEGVFERYRSIIPEFGGFLESLERPNPVHLRFNPLKADCTDLRESLRRKGISVEPAFESSQTCFFARGLDSPGRLPEYHLGHFHPQALTSCLASLVLSAHKEASVLDLCASPGGKCSHMAQEMENTGLIVANEPYMNRHAPLGHTLDRLGVLNTLLTAYPAQEFPLSMRFDRVLTDVPCSGEGRFGVNRLQERPLTSKWLNKIVNLQKKIILRGFDLLKPEGILVYSTCTYNPEENEAVVDYLLKNRRAQLFPVQVDVPFDQGITQWGHTHYEGELEKAARFYPHRVHSVGFFMARIGRRG